MIREPGKGAARIRTAFARAAGEGRAAFIAYVLAGHRSADESLTVAQALLDAGTDLLEIGVPFSDPLADGPVIAEAARGAVAAGAGLDTARAIAAALRGRGYRQPLLLMTYGNPLFAAGDGAMAALADEGIDGLIVPDLPAGEERAFERRAAAAGLGLTFLVAPNTPASRIAAVARASTAFVYVVPRFGVTGARDRLADNAQELLGRVRAEVRDRAPVAAGFGVSAAHHVSALAAAADGVIVGSVLVDAVAAAPPGVAREATLAVVAPLARATSRRTGRHAAGTRGSDCSLPHVTDT